MHGIAAHDDAEGTDQDHDRGTDEDEEFHLLAALFRLAHAVAEFTAPADDADE
jgi:hypothetical protein